MYQNKSKPLRLYRLALNRISNLNKTKSGIIKFSLVFKKLCSSFQINKQQAWELLFLFRDFGFVEIIAGKGIKVNGDFNENKTDRKVNNHNGVFAGVC